MTDLLNILLAESGDAGLPGANAATGGDDVVFDQLTTEYLVEMAIALNLHSEGEFLTEDASYTGHNVVRLNRMTKLKQFTTTNAILIAREKKDSLYKQFEKVSLAKRRLREKIVTKYQSAAAASARKMLAMAGKKNIVDIDGQSSLGKQ